MLLSLDKCALLQERLRYALISTGIHLVTMLACLISSCSHLEFLIFSHGFQTRREIARPFIIRAGYVQYLGLRAFCHLL